MAVMKTVSGQSAWFLWNTEEEEAGGPFLWTSKGAWVRELYRSRILDTLGEVRLWACFGDCLDGSAVYGTCVRPR